MFAVIFEVQPKPERWDDYLALAKRLKPEIEAIDASSTTSASPASGRKGRLLSLSTWRDEKSVVRWRTLGIHHETQETGRTEIFADYHLRVGEIVGGHACARGPKAAGAAARRDRDGSREGGDDLRADAGRAGQRRSRGAAGRPARLAPPHRRPRGLREHLQTRARCCFLVGWRDAAAARAWSPRSSASGTLAPPPGADHPRLRHARPPRGAAILSGVGQR